MISVSQRMKDFNAGLLLEIIKLKYKLLAEDPFRFYRGTAHLFYEDLDQVATLPASPNVWLSGDLHLENFGSYKGDNRQVYFDISDFDEGMLGPALLEITRMVTSIFVGFEVLNFSDNNAENCAKTFLNNYAETIMQGRAKCIELETATGIVKELLQKVSERKTEKWLQKRIKENDKGNFVFSKIEGKQLEIEDKKLKNELIDHITGLALYKDDSLNDFKVLDSCFRIAGTGSMGLKRYLFLLKTESGNKRYWLLDMKQAKQSSLYPYIQVVQPAWKTKAERVTNIKFMMQDVPEALLTTTLFNDDSYIIQEMQPTEDKIEFEQIKEEPDHVVEVMNDMALLTASAQLRSAGREGSSMADELIAFGKTGQWQNYILAYSKNYSSQVKQDYRQYVTGYNNGFFD